MLRIRLQRAGRKNRSSYRIVVAEHSDPVQGRSIELLGYYDPLVIPKVFEVNTDKLMEWIKRGAKPTNTLARLLMKHGVKGMEPYIVEMPDRKKKKAEEEKPAAAEVPPAEGQAEEAKPEEKPVEEASAEEPKEEVKEEAPEPAPAEVPPAAEAPVEEVKEEAEQAPAEEAKEEPSSDESTEAPEKPE